MRTPNRGDSDGKRAHKETAGDYLAEGSIRWEYEQAAASEADVIGNHKRQQRRKRAEKRLPCGETMIAPRLGNWRTSRDGTLTYESTYDRWWRGDDGTKWTDGAIEIYGEGLKANSKPRRTFVEMSEETAKRLTWRLTKTRNCRS